MTRSHREALRSLAASLLLLTMAGALAAQSACTNEGSEPEPAAWSDGPPLHCPPATRAARWHIWTPPHRVLVPRAGHRLVTVRQLPRLKVDYACTDSFLLPVRVVAVHTYGYVLDVVTAPCRAYPRSRPAKRGTASGRASPPAAAATSVAALKARRRT